MKTLLLILLLIPAGVYAMGDVRVELYPMEVSQQAAWKITRNAADITGWRASGQTAFDIPAGVYQVQFRDVHAWHTPQPINIFVTEDSFQNYTATYFKSPGQVTVNIQPYNVRTAGAMFRIDDGEWITPGEIVDVEFGFYQVHFSPIAGWRTPAMQYVQVRHGVRREISVMYVRERGNVYDAATSTLTIGETTLLMQDGGTLKFAGIQFVFNSDGTIAISVIE